MKILMVCLGNICRSPLAEGIIRAKLMRVPGNFEVDSAGTGGWHSGENPDARSIKVARMHGIDISEQRARQLIKDDLQRFDLIFAMDQSNFRNIRLLSAPENYHKIHLYLEFAGSGIADIPDPWYGDFSDFEQVYRLLDTTAERVIQRLVDEYVNKEL